MNGFLTQIIIARWNLDVEDTGWMRILVLVIVAVVYGLSGILKAKKGKLKQEDEDQFVRKPARKPPVSGRGLQEQFIRELRRAAGLEPEKQKRPVEQQPRPKVERPQSAFQRLAAKVEQATRIPTAEPTVRPKVSMLGPQVKPELLELQELPEFTDKTVKKLRERRIGVPEKIPEAVYLPELLLDYADPDELRMAILHYEILGRPLSLRGPGGQIIGL